MSILQNIQSALSNVGITIGEGKFPETSETCGKIVFTGEEDPKIFLGGGVIAYETFRIIVRGNDYRVLQQKPDLIKVSLKNAGYIPMSGYEDIEPEEGDSALQLSIKFKSIKQN